MEDGPLNYLIQFLLVHSQFVIITGLCINEGKLYPSRLLRSKAFEYFGGVSLSLYRNHWTAMGYIYLPINGQTTCENDMSSRRLSKAWRSCATLLLWSPILTIIIAPMIAYAVASDFEEQLADRLKK